MKSLSDSSIIICCIVRDAGNGLKRNIPVIDEFCSYFHEWHVFVYENDSKDDTKDVLKEWSEKDPHRIHVSLNTFGSGVAIPDKKEVAVNPFFSRKRITKMAELRNHYLKYIEEQGWEADYLMVFDFDIAKIDCSSILSSFRSRVEWDVVTAFGYSRSPKLKRRYHDSYALIEYGDDVNPQTEKKIKELSVKYGHLKPDDKWIRVTSAFGGLAIYKFGLLKGVYYSVLDNDDSRVEVRCEHYSILKKISDKKDIRVYINPKMALRYQNITWKIIVNSLRRSLKI